MLNTHREFREEDIVNNGVLNEANLDALDKQIIDLGCYDKVGSAFYNISTNMTFSETRRDPEYVLEWLKHLETLPATSKNVGYLGR